MKNLHDTWIAGGIIDKDTKCFYVTRTVMVQNSKDNHNSSRGEQSSSSPW